MDTPTTALSRVEVVLQAADEYMYVHQIARAAEIDEKETKKVLSTLFSMGQIDQIPSVNRWGPRYAWLAAKPVAVEPPAIPDEDLAAGVQEAITGDDSGDAPPQIPSDDDLDAMFGADLPRLSGNIHEDLLKAIEDTGLRIPADTPSAFRELVESQIVTVQPARYAVAVPRRPLRIVKTRARAEELALAAVRRGAKGAEVFALTVVGRARFLRTMPETFSTMKAFGLMACNARANSRYR